MAEHPHKGAEVCGPVGCGRELGWEAATERMLDAGMIRANEWPGPIATAQESVLWSMYNFALGWPQLSVAFPTRILQRYINVGPPDKHFLPAEALLVCQSAILPNTLRCSTRLATSGCRQRHIGGIIDPS